jgi:two-component system cell cycle sensor histidine kinase/response regulator CckA
MVDPGIAEGAASRQLARTRTQLEGLLRALPDIYFRLDAAGRIVAWHAGREAELHVPPEQFIGRRPEEVVPPQVASLIAGAVQRARASRELVVVDYTLPTPSGDDQFEARLIASDDEVTSIIRNTTPRRRAEAALRETEQRLQAAQKLEAVGRLAGGVAHDFNNLLTVILGRLTFLKRSDGLLDVDRDHVHEAFEATSHAASLTRQLLAFSRRQVMQPVVFLLDDVIESMREMLRGVLGEHIELTMALDASAGLIDADPTQIEQVVLNLVLNARDAMPDGGALIVSTREAELSEEDARHRDDARRGSYVVLGVSDTGRGMTPDVMAHLFEPFFTTKPQGEGTGLGLATVYGIVKQSGGHAIVRSDEGVGSTFELSFPKAARSESSLALPSTVPPMPSLRGAGEGILVVEDEEGVRRLLETVLTDASYVVRSATCGEDAIRMALDEGERFSVLLTDVVMPGMNGVVLASRVRHLRPDVRVLLMSGHEGSLARQGIDPEHAWPILRKPFTEAVLLAQLRDLLSEPLPAADPRGPREPCVSEYDSK